MAEILHQLRLVVYPIVYRVSYIPGPSDFLEVIFDLLLVPEMASTQLPGLSHFFRRKEYM